MRTDRRRFIAGGAALVVAGTTAGSVEAQGAYPNRPIRLVVPYPPGGGTDYFARLAGAAMRRSSGSR